eukprot:1888577-Rhodomonas_salina.1
MPRNAFLSPNTFIASPSDGSACVSGCTPEGEFFAFFAFYFQDGGCAAFEARVKSTPRRGESNSVEPCQGNSPSSVCLHVSPLAAKEVVDATVEACGQTLLDKVAFPLPSCASAMFSPSLTSAVPRPGTMGSELACAHRLHLHSPGQHRASIHAGSAPLPSDTAPHIGAADILSSCVPTR